MNDLVGIIRTQDEMRRALDEIDQLKARLKNVSVEGHRQFNPGWHLALDLPNMLLVSECVARAALERQESRGGHTRDDYPEMSSEWRRRLLECTGDGDTITVTQRPMPEMRPDLMALFELSELEKYYTVEEIERDIEAADHDRGVGHDDRGRPSTREHGGRDGAGRPECALPGVAGHRRGRRTSGLHRRGERGRGRPRHHPPAAGHAGRRPRRALELQGRQVRLLQRGDQRPAQIALHDPHVDLHR